MDLHVIDAIDQHAFDLGASDAAMLCEKLRDTPINIVPHVARNTQELRGVISAIIAYRSSYCDPRKAIPYVHISCHGSQDELLIGTVDHMPWRSLSDILLPLQEKTDYNVPLSISACEGFYGWKLAWGIDKKYRKRRPYYSLVGPTNKEAIGPLCDAFAQFYRRLLMNYQKLKSALEQANRSGGVKLSYTYGSEIVY